MRILNEGVSEIRAITMEITNRFLLNGGGWLVANRQWVKSRTGPTRETTSPFKEEFANLFGWWGTGAWGRLEASGA